MPFRLRKAPKRDLYWVVGPDGKHHSKDPLPKERAEAQMKALYAAERREDEAKIPTAREEEQIERKMEGGNTHSLHGAGPLPELTILQQIAKAAYSTSPPQDIGPFKLRSSTPTLKFYVLAQPSDQRHIDTVVVGIRGTNTSDKQDLYADAKLAIGQLGDTPRWKKDLDDFNAFMSRLSDPKSVDVYGSAHSLGGSILDMFLKAGLIKQGVSYNPAIQLGDAQKDLNNRRIYQEGDPLLAIMGRSAKNVEVRPKKVKKESFFGKVANAASYFIPYVGLVKKGMDTLDAHALDNFTGGTHRINVLKKLGLPDEGHSLADLAKASGIPQKTLQEVYNRGIGAYKTQPSSVRMKGTFKKGVSAPMSKKLSKEQWAMARVYSFIDGNPKHDTDLRGGYTSKVQDKPDVIDRLEDIAVVRRSKGYYVYANDPETRASKRWGPFTKKVAEFEKKLLHQRQRHHLQPIAEEVEGEGGMRGGVGTVGAAQAFMTVIGDEVARLPPRARQAIQFLAQSIEDKLKFKRRKGLGEEKVRDLLQFFKDVIYIIFNQQEKFVDDRRPEVIDRYNQRILDTEINPLLPHLIPNLNMRFHRDGHIVVEYYIGDTPMPYVEVEAPAERERDEEEGVGAPAPEPELAPPAPAPERAAFPPTQPRGRGGMRGGAHTQQQQEWINYLNQTLTREGKLVIPEHRYRYPSEVFILDFAKNNAAYDVTREGGPNSQHTIRHKRGLPPPPIYAPPLPPFLLRAPPRRPPPPPQTEEIDDPLGVTKNLGLGRGSGKDDLDFPVVRKGDKRVELSGPRTAAMMNQRRREKAEAERRIREEAERQEAVRIARQRQIDASDEERQRERRRAESRSKVTGFGQSDYLRKARANAKAYGLDPKKLTMGDGKHKFSYDGVGFGLKSYNDFLLLSAEEKAGRVPKGTAEKKRKAYRARAEKIKGNWKDNKISPNNLAIHILWA